MDPLRLCLAFGPLAVYLLAVALVNLSRRPVVVSAPRETMALGLAISGLVMVGPVELFLPAASTLFFGSYVWLLWAGFYALLVLLAVLVGRPRLTLYNLTAEQLRSVLPNLAVSLDKEARWAGDSLTLPNLGVHLHVERFTSMRNMSLVALGETQSLQGWKALERALAREVGKLPAGRNPRGLILLATAVALLGVLAFQLVSHPLQITESLHDMLRLPS